MASHASSMLEMQQIFTLVTDPARRWRQSIIEFLSHSRANRPYSLPTNSRTWESGESTALARLHRQTSFRSMPSTNLSRADC
jgi:hypothetical protein